MGVGSGGGEKGCWGGGVECDCGGGGPVGGGAKVGVEPCAERSIEAGWTGPEVTVRVTRALARPVVWLVIGYQHTFSRAMPPACRFEPTCSWYAREALERHGIFRGGWLALRRLSRCRPGGGRGYDPVPE